MDGLEPMLMNPEDADARSLTEGQLVRIFNGRGTCLARLTIGHDIRPGVIQISTGAWFDPGGTTCRNGNPNVLTPDKGTSRLAQGPIAHSCLVEVAPYEADTGPSNAYTPPVIL